MTNNYSGENGVMNGAKLLTFGHQHWKYLKECRINITIRRVRTMSSLISDIK